MDTIQKSIPTGVKILSNSITEINTAGSYLVNKCIEMNGDFTFPLGVTLYFEGGYIIGNGKLVGNHTRIVAPIEQIFYNNITPAGTWDIDVAYPHWFGMKTVTEIMAQNNLSEPTIDEDNSASMSFDIYDSSNAINRAIRMKGKGKVFIPKGRYIVTHTIFMSVGIQLCGEGGLKDGNSPFADEKEYPYTCTCIYSYPQSYCSQDNNVTTDSIILPYYKYDFDENYILKINIIKEDINNSLNYTDTAYGEKPDLYPPAGTIVSDICFSNWQFELYTAAWIKDRLFKINLALVNTLNEVPRIPLLRCILAMGGFEIKNVHTYNFYNAVSCVWHYNDSKKISDCGLYIINKDPYDLKNKYNSYLEFPISEYFEDYEHSFSAIYFHGNGDALEIERNHIDNSFTYSVNLSSCGGGVIFANILNSPVKLSNNKSVIFEGNHLENGSYVYIYSSNINIINNFFIKGKNPSIILESTPDSDKSVPEVSLTGNQFCFIEPQEKACPAGSKNNYCWTDNEQFSVKDICDYDIGLIANIANGPSTYESFVNAKLHQNYRYAMGALGFGTNHTFGCKIIILQKDNNGAYFIDNTNFSGEELSDFNQHSYFLSNESQIMPYNTFIGNAKIDHTNIATPLYCMRNGRTRWELDDNKMSYTYYAIPVFDMTRRIVGVKSTIQFDRTKEEIDGNIDPKVISKGERGVLLSIGSELAKFKGLVNIRLYRQGASSTTFKLDMVDIPIIGNSFFYDNGFSIAGFRWMNIYSASEYDRLLFSNPEIFNQNITSVKFENDNVICWAPEKPIYGTWRVNDIVYNNNKDQQAGDPIMWIYTENGWKAK